MPTKDSRVEVVERLFRAMAAGPSGEEPMMALFADDAVLVEPFTGVPREHVGKDAIRRAYRELFHEPPPPDMRLTLHRVERDGDSIEAHWSCTASTYASDRLGVDHFTVRDGFIRRLSIVITQSETLKENTR
jgi:ketosteroid isomerase-like protein